MTLTKEQIIETLEHGISVASGFPDSKKAQIDLAIFRIALASLTAEPALTVGHGSDALAYRSLIQSFAPGTKLYTAPPAPLSVPTFDESKYALVPVEPTHEMLEAGDEQFGTYDVYRRMITAAPQQEVKNG